jgi:hypothetical protein
VDTRTLISHLVGSLAWPIAAIVGLAMVRPAILNLLPKMRTLRFRDLEATFGQELARVRQIVESSEDPGVPLDAGLSSEEAQNFLRLAEISPRAAVIEAWGLLESQARSIVEARRPRRSARPLSAASLGDTLLELGLLDQDGVQAWDALRSLRNQAAHEPLEITTDQGVEFGNLARSLATTLEEHDG